MPRQKLITVSVDAAEVAQFKRVAKSMSLPMAAMVRKVVADLDKKKKKKS
jgi:hypothetical protein